MMQTFFPLTEQQKEFFKKYFEELKRKQKENPEQLTPQDEFFLEDK